MKRSNKSLRGYFEILFNLENGVKCGVATLNKDDYIRRFKEATGERIELTKSDKDTIVYTIKLCK